MTGRKRAAWAPTMPGQFVWLGFCALIVWARIENTWVLAAAGVFVGLSALWARGSVRHAISTALLATGIGVALHTDAVSRHLTNDWESYWGQRQEEVAARLGRELDELVSLGDSSVERVVRAAATADGREALQDSLREVVEETGIAAAVYGPAGRLVAWEGEHHGRFPSRVLNGASRYVYAGPPLFSYLYHTADIPGSQGTAVVATLMRSDLPESFATGLGDFASRFREQTGERIGIARSDRVAGPGVFDFGWPDEALISMQIQEPDALSRRAERRGRGIGIVVALLALAWFLESFAGPRRDLPYSLGALAAAAALLPLERLSVPADLVDPAFFQLPGPFPLTLGRVVLLCAAAVPLAVLAAPGRRRVGSWAAPPVVAVSFPFFLHWMGSGVSLALMGTSDARWILFQASVTLILTLVTGVALACRVPGDSRNVPGLVLLGVAVAAILSTGVGVGVRVGPGAALPLSALWALPAVLMVRGLGDSRHLSFMRWFCAFWLAGTAVLPFAWSMRTEARQEIAEGQMRRLGVTPEPYPDSLLKKFAHHADSLGRAGAGDVELMYQAWVASGLAERGSPIFLTLWSQDNVPSQELRLGVKGDRSPVVDSLLPELRAGGTPAYRRPAETDVHHLIAAPLSGGRLVTGTIPPRRTIAAPSALGPLFASVEEMGNEEFLTLVRVVEGEPRPPEDSVVWRRNDEGWRAEGLARYPDGLYSVFYTISIPNLQVMLARATLILALNLAVFSVLWLLSVGILGLRFSVPVDWRGLLHSFRARVTWTLFGFFIVSNVLFGTLAYRTLAGASERTATALAERVVSQIGEAYLEEGGSMELLSRRVGADLLEYRHGELVGGSVDELIELGLYESWVDPRIYDDLESGQRLRASKVENLGGWRYVVAHRRLPDGDIVASPVPLRAGAAALRRRDVADLLGFAIVLGPVLSLGLALFVGRALSRPIQTLQVASERVGSGNLAVHLPEDRVDEFGSVFTAFNRMVLRLDNARRELLRTTRRTEAIVEGAATGVIAVDTRGRVTVANPRAELLLATPLETGAEIPRSGSYAAELADWLDAHGGSGAAESDADFKWGERRIRGRARRIAREGQVGGVVVNLEDVTDELHSERILAWGEMAKQVAHEVKNPLTPIKLSVQHLRRAWNDRRSDFDRILERNVGAILREIDRLASIARSFSRLASPGAADRGPLASVDVGVVFREVLDLYRSGGESSIRVQSDMSEALPDVLCRPDELKEVLVNLLENARAAMPDGGVVRIGAAGTGDSAGTVTVTVEDQGTGIPAELLPRIFEPQFSTRSTGSGLGLAIAKRLVDSWGGVMEVDSEVGEGTRVSIRLRTEATSRRSAAREDHDPGDGDAVTIE
ncbi:MAG: ATP-binding protein [Gemmatimonadota bacterium]|nr:ATP-binding protein [Gemmatimonadota bacterium]MDE2872196.1 ATP-binding protein [Gemmatimonadota bacterium]